MARKRRRSSNDERINAIRLLQQGYTKTEVANIPAAAESSVYEWQKKFRDGGLAALSTKIASGRKSLLTDEQLIKLYKWLRGNPRQAQFDFGLWTRKIVRELIKREFGIDYTPQNVGKILKTLGFSPQRPVYQALERDPEKPPWRCHLGASRADSGREAYRETRVNRDGIGRQYARRYTLDGLHGIHELDRVHRIPEPSYPGCRGQDIPYRRPSEISYIEGNCELAERS